MSNLHKVHEVYLKEMVAYFEGRSSTVVPGWIWSKAETLAEPARRRKAALEAIAAQSKVTRRPAQRLKM